MSRQIRAAVVIRRRPYTPSSRPLHAASSCAQTSIRHTVFAPVRLVCRARRGLRDRPTTAGRDDDDDDTRAVAIDKLLRPRPRAAVRFEGWKKHEKRFDLVARNRSYQHYRRNVSPAAAETVVKRNRKLSTGDERLVNIRVSSFRRVKLATTPSPTPGTFLFSRRLSSRGTDPRPPIYPSSRGRSNNFTRDRVRVTVTTRK